MAGVTARVRAPRRRRSAVTAPPAARRGPAAAPHAGRAGVHGPGPGAYAARCAVLTVSDTRRGADDTGGALARTLLERAGHRVIAREWTRDAVASIRRAARALLGRRGLDVLVVTGGTGVAPRDVTPEALEPLYDRPLPGFGEAFRHRSWDQVGAAAWLSRASAGLTRGRLIVLLPGSPRAVELAIRDVLLPELAHVLRLAGRVPPEE